MNNECHAMSLKVREKHHYMNALKRESRCSRRQGNIRIGEGQEKEETKCRKAERDKD